MSFIISLAPIGVFTYMAWVVATQGSEILVSLLLVIVCAYLGYIVHAVLVYSLSAKIFVGMSPVKFFKGAFAAMIFAFTSTSSAATLPVSISAPKRKNGRNTPPSILRKNSRSWRGSICRIRNIPYNTITSTRC